MTRPGTQSGFSLIEILVGMAIGLIGIVLINQAQIVFEGYKRSTAGAGESQVNGALALYAIERDLRMAGAGVAHSQAFNCTYIQWYYNGTSSQPPTARSLPELYMPPVRIITGTGVPDQIYILASSATDRVMPGTLNQGASTFVSDLAVDNPYGYAANDFIAIQTGTSCYMGRVVADPSTTGNRLRHDNSTGSLYNPPAGGSFPGISSGSLIFNLGSAPMMRTYAISSNNLLATDALDIVTGGTADTVANDIVDLRAQYGMDDGSGGGTANDGVVDQFTTTTPTTAVGWQQVLAIRIGVLARSQAYQRPDPPGSACTATTAAPTWTGGTFTTPETIPSCYRYSVFETVVPLRNMIWRGS